MDHSPHTYTDENIGRYFPDGREQLLLSIDHPVPPGQRGAVALDVGCVADEVLHIPLHPQLIQQRSAQNCHYQPQDHIHHRHSSPKYAHQQHQGAQIYHR